MGLLPAPPPGLIVFDVMYTIVYLIHLVGAYIMIKRLNEYTKSIVKSQCKCDLKGEGGREKSN